VQTSLNTKFSGIIFGQVRHFVALFSQVSQFELQILQSGSSGLDTSYQVPLGHVSKHPWLSLLFVEDGGLNLINLPGLQKLHW
jgi:hypothetical protein